MDVLEMLRQEQRSKRQGEPLKEQYVRVEIDLSTAREDEEVHISGNLITVASCDGGATTTFFKLNNKHSRKIYPSEASRVAGNFGGVYLTNSAEAGKKLILYIGRDIYIFPSKAGATKLLKADGTTINPGEASEYDTVLGSIETAVEFGGNVYSKQQTSTNALVALGAVKLRDVVIRNDDAANAVDLGETAGTVGAFRSASMELPSGASIGFTQVNLATLFILSSVADSHALLQVIGVEI